MATTQLVSDLIDAGERLIEILDGEQISVTSAFWYYDTDAEQWRLILAIPSVEEQGAAEAQKVIGAVLQRGAVPQLFLRDIAIVSPRDPVVSALRRVVRGQVGKTRVAGSTVGNVFIQDSLVYRST